MAGSPYAGWWVGLFVGFGVVVVVVAVVAVVLTFASRIGDRTQEAIEAFEVARAGAEPLSRVEGVNDAADRVLAATRAARRLLPGGVT